MLKAILVDVDNTLFDFEGSALLALEKSAERYNIKLPDNILSIFIKHNNELWNEIENKTLTFPELQRLRFDRIFKEAHIDNIDGYEFELTFDEVFEDCTVEIEGARAMLSYLSERYTLAIASNASRKQQMKRLESTGLIKYFDYIFTSEELNAAKPDLLFYKRIIDSLGIKPDEALMIGDSLKADIIGAKNAGLHTMWFNRSKAEHSEYAGYEIEKLIDAIAIL